MVGPKNERLMYSKKPKYGGYRFVRYRHEENAKRKTIAVIFRYLDYFLVIAVPFLMGPVMMLYAFFLYVCHLEQFKTMSERSGRDRKMPMSAFIFRWISPILTWDAARLFIALVDRAMEGPFIKGVDMQPFPYQTAKQLTLGFAISVVLSKKIREQWLRCIVQELS